MKSELIKKVVIPKKKNYKKNKHKKQQGIKSIIL